jgi:hypothetical protein
VQTASSIVQVTSSGIGVLPGGRWHDVPAAADLPAR